MLAALQRPQVPTGPSPLGNTVTTGQHSPALEASEVHTRQQGSWSTQAPCPRPPPMFVSQENREHWAYSRGVDALEEGLPGNNLTDPGTAVGRQLAPSSLPGPSYTSVRASRGAVGGRRGDLHRGGCLAGVGGEPEAELFPPILHPVHRKHRLLSVQ